MTAAASSLLKPPKIFVLGACAIIGEVDDEQPLEPASWRG